MKLVRAIGEALMASAGVISIYSFTLDVIPEPYNSIIFGGGAGLLTAAAVAVQSGRGRAEPIGEVGALPGVPEEARKPSKQKVKVAEKEKLLKRYDKTFSEMVSRHTSDSRLDTLEKMKPILYELSPDIKTWSGDVRIRMYLLMQAIAKDMDTPEYANAALGLLVLILSKGGNSALEMARPIFGEKIQSMYLDPRYENERFLPRLLLLLDNYDPRRVETLTKEAIHVWGDQKFSAASEYLGFEELKERGLRNSVKGMLGSEIAMAGVQGDRTALDRAVELYHTVQ